MGSPTLRLACVWLFAACLLSVANGWDENLQAGDGDGNLPQLTRKLLSGGWCSCSDEACPCHLDTSWLEANECPSCPVYGCGECNPLKCDECKRCCEGTVLSDDRKMCTCPTCDITGCLECDAEDCSKCLVCHQGYELGADRKCDWKECPVPHCQKCDLLNRHECERCLPYLTLTNDRKACECPECAISGCEKCDPKKCDECLECAGNLVPSHDRKTCPEDSCNCTILHCAKCEKGCYACEECEYDYEVTYDKKCKATICKVPNCAECFPYDADRCKECHAGYIVKEFDYVPGNECVCDPAKCTVPHCAVCTGQNCTECDMCDVGFAKQADGSCGIEDCYVPGCEECCKDDPDQCAVCMYGYRPAGDNYTQCGQCVCDPCSAPYCDTCSVDDCEVCKVCKKPYVLDYAGNCVCDVSYSPIAHCHTYDRKDCTKCEACDKDYMWNGTHCVCDRSEVEHCTTYSTEDCRICLVCDKGLIPSKDGSKCICDPANCNVEYCQTCDPSTCSGYSPTCLQCKEGLVVSPDGQSCECPYCAVDGCKQCSLPDCKSCEDCKPPAKIGDDHKCSCPKCNIEDCEECDPKDCYNACKTCKAPKVPDGSGGCKCPAVHIDHCEVYNSKTCLCDECEVLFDLADGGKSCECNCDANVGCKSCSPDTCKCDECEPDLTKSICGYCFQGKGVPGCAWNFVESRNGESCERICSCNSRYTTVVKASKHDDYLTSYACTVDLKGKEALRPGENLPSNDTGSCYAEYHTGPEPVDKQVAKRKGAAAFNCICQTPDGPLTWVPKHESGEDNRLSFGEGCNKICGKKGLYPVHVMGNHIYGDVHTKSPFYVCRVDGHGSGYNIDQFKPPQARVWNGFCMTARMASENYDCLCAKECDYPDCGKDVGYQSAYVDGEVLTT